MKLISEKIDEIMTPTRPALRYHGGKWMLANWIISFFPSHKIYVEPFGGGASVLLKKERTYAEIYNDLDGELVNLFRVMRDHGDDLKNRLHLTPFSREEFNLSYEPASDPVEQARRTVARSFMGFGSNAHNRKTGFRSFARLQSASPAHDWANYPGAVTDIMERLRGVVIENRPAADLMLAQDSINTLFYLDPPYVKSTRTDTADDYRFEMTDLEHEELAGILNGLDGMVIVSGYPCDLYNDLFSGWVRTDKTALADGASPRTECLWINRACHEALKREQEQKELFA